MLIAKGGRRSYLGTIPEGAWRSMEPDPCRRIRIAQSAVSGFRHILGICCLVFLPDNDCRFAGSVLL